MIKPKVIFLVTEDWCFLSHRVDLALALKKEGAEVIVASAAGTDVDKIRSLGLMHHRIRFRRRSVNLFFELLTLLDIFRLYRKVRPNLVHHVAVKPVVYGSLVAKLSRVPATVNTITGLGFVFTSENRLARSLRHVVRMLFRLCLGGSGSRLILQNQDDYDFFCRSGFVEKERAVMILGSGVDTEKFSPKEKLSSFLTSVLLPARILWDKGVGEFVEASRILQSRRVKVRMVLAGFRDEGNPSNVPESTLQGWIQEGLVEWLGHQKDMPTILEQFDIVALPSYREGVPLALIEAAAAGKPIITTDVPGCREIVKHNFNGLLVPVKEAEALADAIQSLVQDSTRCEQMGRNGRQMVLNGFSKQHVIQQTFQVYRQLLSNVFPSFLSVGT